MLNKALIAALVGLTAAGANAELFKVDRAYVGAGVGETSFSKVCDTLPSGSTVSSTSCDDSDTSWRLGVGYELTPYVAVELNYFGLGKGTTGATYTNGGSGSGDFRSKSVWAVQIGAHTKVNFVDRTTVYGKLGAAFSKYSGDYSGNSASNNSGSWSTSGNKVAPIVSAGLAYGFTPKWSAGLQIDYIYNLGEVGPSSDKVSATLFSLGLNYMF